MIALGNDSGRLKLAELYANKDGVILNEDAFDQYFNINNEIVKFPQKDKCVLNLSSLVFCIPEGLGANSYLNRKSSSFTGYDQVQKAYRVNLFNGANITENVTTWGTENVNADIQNVPNNQFQYSSLNKSLFKNRTAGFEFYLNGDWNRYSTTAGGNCFTFSIRFKASGTPNTYRSFFQFDNRAANTPLRMEYANSGRYTIYSNSGRPEGVFPGISLTLFNTFTIVVERDNIQTYANGVVGTGGTISCGTLVDRNVFTIGSWRARNDSNKDIGKNLEIQSIRLWDCALSSNEIQDLVKIDRAGW